MAAIHRPGAGATGAALGFLLGLAVIVGVIALVIGRLWYVTTNDVCWTTCVEVEAPSPLTGE